MTNHDVVKKLVGKICPIGESNADAERLENLKEMCHLVEMLLIDISDMEFATRNNKQWSVRKCGDYAANFLNKTVATLKP